MTKNIGRDGRTHGKRRDDDDGPEVLTGRAGKKDEFEIGRPDDDGPVNILKYSFADRDVLDLELFEHRHGRHRDDDDHRHRKCGDDDDDLDITAANLGNFVRIDRVGNDAQVFVDLDGAGTKHGFVQVATLKNFSGAQVRIEIEDAKFVVEVDAGDNVAPTAVGFANATASIGENTDTTLGVKVADIVVVDDALGSETLALTGADAGFFEIVGTELRLKAGVVLDFETKNSYAVQVTADDPTVGGTPDATSAVFTVNVTDVNEAPAAAVAITAIDLDSGTAGDFTTSDTTLTVSGTNGALDAGEKVQVSNDGGATWMDVTQGTATTWGYDDAATHSASFTYDARVIDAAANVGNTDSQLITIDTAAPTVVVNIEDAALNDGNPDSLVSFEFSENVTGLDVGDLTPVGGALSGFATIDGNSYTATFTATDGVQTIGSVAVGTGYTDAAGNTGTAGSDTVAIDTRSAAPIANSDIVLTNIAQGTGILIPDFALLFNDTDADNDPLSITTVANPAAGDTVMLSFGDPVYTDNGTQGGVFDYKAFDGTGESALSAQVTVDTQSGDIVNGTDANEILIASNQNLGGFYTLNAGGGNDFLFGGATVDVLHGGDGDDFLFGGDGTDELYGEAGNDVLSGGSNSDALEGGVGDDTLSGGEGDDVLAGGEGVDLLDYSNMTTGFSFTLADGGTGTADVDGTDIYFDMEGVIGGSGNDSLTGNAGDNFLQGGGGTDTMTGGNADIDTFKFNATSDSSTTLALSDLIKDFVHGTDKIDLSTIDANSGLDGDQAFLFGGNNANTVANSVTWSQDLGNTFLQIDNNGDAIADMQIVLEHAGLGLTDADFIL